MKLIRLLGILLTLVLVGQGQPRQIAGVVSDQNGAAIANAAIQISVMGGSAQHQTSSDSEGRFSIDADYVQNGTLLIEAPGFAPYTRQLSGTDTDLEIELSPASVGGIVTVTRSETRLEETSASVVLLDRGDLDATAALTLDDRLRQIPGFSLFRRAGSRTANPTTQGVSLRGVGASGASRALVLADGVPLNDPFGGWVYWGRVPAESISQIEVLRGAVGDLYGSSAIGGVVSVVTRRPGTKPFASIETSYGTQRTPFVSAYTSMAVTNWSGSLAGEFFRTAGFIPVDVAQRGSIDTKAGVSRWVIVPFLQRTLGEKGRFFGSGEFYHESRTNGTPLQTNDTDLQGFTGGLDWQATEGHLVSLRANGGSQKYNQTFSAISADRNSELLNRLQRVPSKFFGFSGQWTANYRQNVLFAGFEMRDVRGHSDETGFAAGSPTSRVDSGGREFTSAFFAGVIVPVHSRLTAAAGFRMDRWSNLDGFTRTISLVSGTVSQTEFPARSASAFSPRISILYRLTKQVSLASTFSEGFRRPTLNELYRNFRVGDILTLANADLRPERARSFDAAAIISGFERRLYFRGGMFCTTISGNVANATLTVTPTLITRQRQNIGRTRSCGLEADGNFQPASNLRISGGYLFVDSRVVSFPVNTALQGLRIPQIARHQFSSQLTYKAPMNTTLALQFRAASAQFDDDLNQFRLKGFATFDVFASRRFGSKVEVFAAVENLFDSKIESGRTPVLTLASPRTLRLGLRLRLGRN